MMGNKSLIFRFSDVEVREHEFSLLKAGKVSAIEPKAFRVLLHLLRNPQKLISKEELLNAVWGDTAVTEGSLTRCIWLLRRPLPPLRVAEYTQITHDGRHKELAGTDGSRLYLNRDLGPQPAAQVAISGGEIAQVPVALPLHKIMDVSPDGSTLLVTSNDGGRRSLWNVEVPSGSLRRLLTDAWVNSAAWSPDGRSRSEEHTSELQSQFHL